MSTEGAVGERVAFNVVPLPLPERDSYKTSKTIEVILRGQYGAYL